jgi:lipoprotein-anchoring transpeptidase ErfK/SrfK
MEAMSRSGVGLRPRYGRITAFAAATSTTLVSLVGTLFTSPADEPAGARSGISLTGASQAGAPAASAAEPDPAAAAALAAAPSTGVRASLSVGLAGRGTPVAPPPSSDTPSADQAPAEDPPPPPRSGHGRRVVFSESDQRVWLVDGDGQVRRTYLVSGSVYDNLDPGSYEVYSRSMYATGVDGSDLRYMVRFTQGWNDPIGFHWIPRMNGERMQTRAELGTPQSHGCVRQAAPDARALWRFAPVGTRVVVTA